jgi:hypothetical protein
MNKFQVDLARGRVYEMESLKLFKYKSAIEPITENRKFFDWELILEDDSTILLEVKSDFLGYKTGNFALEYECNGCGSGITTTTADYYIIYIVKSDKSFDVYKVPTNMLIVNNNWRSVSGGDGYRSKMYLVPIDYLSPYKLDNTYKPQCNKENIFCDW